MSRLVQLMLSKAQPDTPLGRYTALNGLVYLALGALFYLWPGSVQVLLRAAPFQAGEEGLARAIGVTLAVIGYLYVFGGRSGQERFGAATIPDRFVIPFLLVPLVATGKLSPNLGLPFAILDPLLAVGAWIIFARTRPRPA